MVLGHVTMLRGGAGEPRSGEVSGKPAPYVLDTRRRRHKVSYAKQGDRVVTFNEATNAATSETGSTLSDGEGELGTCCAHAAALRALHWQLLEAVAMVAHAMGVQGVASVPCPASLPKSSPLQRRQAPSEQSSSYWCW
jgi:hypothetical protein